MKKLITLWWFRFAAVLLALTMVGGYTYLTRYQEDLSTVDGIFESVKRRSNQRLSGLAITEDGSWMAQMNDGTPLSIEGYDFKLNSQAGKTLNFGFSDDAYSQTTVQDSVPDISALGPVIDDVFNRAGYNSADTANGKSFVKGDATCVYAISGYGSLTLSCVDQATLHSIAEEAKPFVSAYVEANDSIQQSDIAIGPVLIKNENSSHEVYTASKTEGYKIAEALITLGEAKGVALFYQKDGGDWTFVSEASDEYGFRCGDFEKSEDARKAFYDQVCLSETGHVRLDTDNRALQ